MKLLVKASKDKQYIGNHEQPINAMATINPKLNTQHQSLVFVAQRDEGPIPHLHVEFQNSKGQTVSSYISLQRAEYSTHHSDGVLLPKNIKEEFLKVMNTLWMKWRVEELVYDSDGKFSGETQLVPATGYEAAVDIWLDTWEKDEEKGKAKFAWDEQTGKAIMPNYDSLKTRRN